MKLLRTLSTSRLLLLVLVVGVLAVGLGAIAKVATGGGGATPPDKPLANALHDSLAGAAPAGITARIRFTNKLFPSGAITGQAGSALMSGASGRLWAANDGRGRLELQSNAGDVQIVWNQSEITVFDASSNTVYRASLPQHADKPGAGKSGVPALDEIRSFLTKLGTHVDLSDARPADVGGEPAYSVRVSPRHDGGLLGAVELAWDAARPVPLRIGIYAQGASTPVLELTATHIAFGAVPASDVAVSPPPDARVVDLGGLTRHGGDTQKGLHAGVTGYDAVKAKAPFAIVAPAGLVGLPRQDIRLVGRGDSATVVAVYGRGLGAVVVVERTGHGSGALGSLPQVSLNGITAHELATQLGTALTWKRGAVTYVLAGSVPPAAAEAAARALG